MRPLAAAMRVRRIPPVSAAAPGQRGGREGARRQHRRAAVERVSRAAPRWEKSLSATSCGFITATEAGKVRREVWCHHGDRAPHQLKTSDASIVERTQLCPSPPGSGVKTALSEPCNNHL